MAAEHRIALSLMIDESLEEQVEAAAASEDLSVSDYIAEVLRRALDIRRVYQSMLGEPAALTPGERPWPRSFGAGSNPNFDARDTEAYLEKHWRHDIEHS